MIDGKQLFGHVLNDGQIKENELMAHHNTYGIGGPADIFLTPSTKDELVEILQISYREGVPVTLIGGGSNCLISDKGIRGITICTARMKPDMIIADTWLTAVGGVSTGAAARFAWKHGLTGLEWAVGIPGTLCGAVFMNANGYGGQMKQIVEKVYALTKDGQEDKVYDWDDLKYGESDSIFMHNGDIIYGVKLHLAEGDMEEIKAQMDKHQESRRTKQPLDKRSAGTMYLRPPGYHVGPMIKACGLIGFSIGDAQVSDKHPDFVVNNGNASCQDVLAVLHEVQRRIKEQFGVHVPLDVRLLGEGLKQER